MVTHVIVLFELPDGLHVAGMVVHDIPERVTDRTIARHVGMNFNRHAKIRPVKWWRARHANDLAETKAKLLAKYPNRPTLQEVTGGDMMRAIDTGEPYGTTEDEDLSDLMS